MSDVEHLSEPEAYALGALEPDEMAAGARHLADCPACTREVARFARVATLLPYTLDDGPARGARGSWPRARSAWRWGLLAAACLAALLWGGNAMLRAAHDREAAVAEHAVVQMIAARPMREMPLRPMSPLAGKARATLMVGHANGMKSAVVVSQLPPAPPHMSYRLWYEHGTHGVPGPQLVAMADGTAVCVVAGDVAQRYDHVGIVLAGDGKHTMLFSGATARSSSPA